MASKEVTKLTGHTSAITALAVLQDGITLASTAENEIRIWNTNSGELTKTITGTFGIVHCLAALDDHALAGGTENGKVHLWNTTNGELIRTLDGHKDVFSYAWEHEDRDGVTTLNRLNTPGAVYCLALLKDGNLASGSLDNTIIIWNQKAGKLEKTLKGHTDFVKCLCVLPSAKLASGSGDKTIIIWNTDNGEQLEVMNGATARHKFDVCCLAFLPESGWLASGSADKTIKYWDFYVGQLENVLWSDGHTDTVVGLVLSKDGKVLSSSDDKTIKIWTDPNGFLLATIKTEYVRSLVLLQDGRLVSHSATSPEICIWKETNIASLENDTKVVNDQKSSHSCNIS